MDLHQPRRPPTRQERSATRKPPSGSPSASASSSLRGAFSLPPAAVEETLDAYAKTWLAGLTGNLKASTIRFYGDNLDRYVLPLLGHRPLTAVSRADARELIISCRKKGLKLNTVKGIARTLSAVLSQAVEDEKFPANPALRLGRHLRRGDEPKHEVQPLTRDEAAHLVAVATRALPAVASVDPADARTGLRLGEQIALQWGDIDWHGRFIIVQRNLVRGVLTSTKSHQRRRVDMSAQLFATLLEWRRQQRARWLKKGKPVPEWVFPSLEGTALEERNVRHVFTRMLEKAELRQHPHARPAAHVRVTAAAAGRVGRLRERAARTRQHSDHRRHVRPPHSRRESRGRRSAR